MQTTMQSRWQKLEDQFGDSLQKDISLAAHTTMQIGGPAKYFFEATTQQVLITIIKFAKQNNLPFLVIGGGSNLLVNDRGINCLIIKNSAGGINQNGNKIVVQSGTALQTLVDYSIEHSLAGLNKMTGIPGTVGGAVYGNAGAYGQTISDHITSVKVLSVLSSAKPGFLASLKANPTILSAEPIKTTAEKMTLPKRLCGFDYRTSSFKTNQFTILEITFELPTGDTQTLAHESKEVLTKRLERYPKDIKCPGSLFKNIPVDTLSQQIVNKIPPEKILYHKISAGYLLEKTGAKGDHLGQIKIADYHANLFINQDGGTAKDCYMLAKKYSAKVKQKFGIKLEFEVQLINLP